MTSIDECIDECIDCVMKPLENISNGTKTVISTFLKASGSDKLVLRFGNLSNDPSQDYFADGITENLTTDISRIRGSLVIARASALRSDVIVRAVIVCFRAAAIVS